MYYSRKLNSICLGRQTFIFKWTVKWKFTRQWYLCLIIGWVFYLPKPQHFVNIQYFELCLKLGLYIQRQNNNSNNNITYKDKMSPSKQFDSFDKKKVLTHKKKLTFPIFSK